MITLKDEAIKKESYGLSGGRIETSGAYTGYFTKAYETVSERTGSKAIRLEFTADDGSFSTVDIWYWSGKNNDYIERSMNELVYPLMSLFELKTLREKPNHSIDVYDFDARGMVSKKFTAFPDLANKPIGIVFQMEEYQKNNGGLGLQARALRFFDAETRQSAKEKMNNLPAKAVEALLEKLEPVKRLNLSAKQEVKAKDAQIIEKAADFNDDFYDIPF